MRQLLTIMGQLVHNINMEYKLQPIEISAESIDTLEIPSLEDRIIEKRGDVNTFTINDLINNKKQLDKLRKETTAKLENENAKMENIAHFHPFVLDHTDEQMNAISMYYASKKFLNEAKELLTSIENVTKAEAEELYEIIKQIPEVQKIKDQMYE